MGKKLVKILCVAAILALATVLSMSVAAAEVWNGTIANGFENGSGTENEPYIIKTPEQLAYLAYSVNSGITYEGKYIKLANDVCLNWENWDTTNFPENIWTAIGTPSNKFQGAFDGDGHEISGIYTESTGPDYQGLFGYSGGTIKNVGVVDSVIMGSVCIGGVVGHNYGTVENCYFTGIIFGVGTYPGTDNVGGIVGDNGGTITCCYNMGDIIGTDYVGGIAGFNFGTVTGSYNTGNVSGDTAGGIVGIIGYTLLPEETGGTVKNCYNIGNVNGNGNVGSIAGENVTGGLIYNYYLSGCVTNEIGLTHNQMMQASSYTGFDFDTVWAIDSTVNGGYPYLRTTPVYVPDVRVYVNRDKVKFDVPPTIIDGRTLVPLRAIFEALGATVDWNQTTKTVTGTKDGTTIIMTVGQSTFTVNGDVKKLDVPSQIIDGRTLVPVRAIAESLGVIVKWNGDERAVLIADISKKHANYGNLDLSQMDSETLIATIKPYIEAFELYTGYSTGYLEVLGIVYKKEPPPQNSALVLNYKTLAELDADYKTWLSQYIDLSNTKFLGEEYAVSTKRLREKENAVYFIYDGIGGAGYSYFYETAKVVKSYDNVFIIEIERCFWPGDSTIEKINLAFSVKDGRLLLIDEGYHLLVNSDIPDSFNLSKMDEKTLIETITPHIEALNNHYSTVNFRSFVQLSQTSIDPAMVEAFKPGNISLIENYSSIAELDAAYRTKLSEHIALDMFPKDTYIVNTERLIEDNKQLYFFTEAKGYYSIHTYSTETVKLIEAKDNKFVVRMIDYYGGGGPGPSAENVNMTFEYKDGRLLVTNVEFVK